VPRIVAGRAQRDAIIHVISQLRVWPPGLDMMSVQLAAASPTILTGPVVPREDSLPPSTIMRVPEQRLANRRVSTSPVRVFGADEVRVPGRYVSSPADATPDGCTMFGGQFATGEFRRHLGAGLARHDPSNTSLVAHNGCCNLAPSLGRLGGVPFGGILICLSASDATELTVGAEPSGEYRFAILAGCCSHFPSHNPIIPQRRVGCKPR